MNKHIEQYDLVKSYTNSILDTIKFLDGVFGLRKESQQNLKRNMGQLSFNKEFRTIRLSIPRQTGNTSIVVNLLNKLPYSVLYLRKYSQKSDYEYKYDLDSKQIFIRVEDMYMRRIEYVIVDQSSYMNPRELESLYSIDAEFFIFIQ